MRARAMAPAPRRRARAVPLAVAAVTALAALAGALWLAPTRTAKIAYAGRTLELPLPIWSARLGGGEGHARYLGLGDPEFSGRSGAFTHVEQLGSGHAFSGDGVRLLLVTRKRSRLFTEMDLRVAPLPPGAP